MFTFNFLNVSTAGKDCEKIFTGFFTKPTRNRMGKFSKIFPAEALLFATSYIYKSLSYEAKPREKLSKMYFVGEQKEEKQKPKWVQNCFSREEKRYSWKLTAFLTQNFTFESQLTGKFLFSDIPS